MSRTKSIFGALAANDDEVPKLQAAITSIVTAKLLRGSAQRREKVSQLQSSGEKLGAWCFIFPSRQNCLHHFPMHIGQPKIAPVMPIRKLSVIDAEQVQNRRVHVVATRHVV